MTESEQDVTLPYTIVSDEHADREKWLNDRRALVGASDGPAILGYGVGKKTGLHVQPEKWDKGDDPLDTPVWQEAAYWGRAMEPLILERLSQELDTKVERIGKLLQSIEYPWLGCTPDGYAHGVVMDNEDDDWSGTPGSADPAFVQAKNAMHASAWEAFEDGRIKPYRVWFQVQTEMVVTDRPWCYVAVLCGGNNFQWARVPRHQEFIDKILLPQTMEFHQRTLDEEPWTGDGYNEMVSDALHSLYPEDNGTTVMLDAKFARLDDRRAKLNKLAKHVKQQLDGVNNEIKLAIGEASFGQLPNGGRFKFKWGDRKGYVVAAGKSRPLVRLK